MIESKVDSCSRLKTRRWTWNTMKLSNNFKNISEIMKGFEHWNWRKRNPKCYSRFIFVNLLPNRVQNQNKINCWVIFWEDEMTSQKFCGNRWAFRASARMVARSFESTTWRRGRIKIWWNKIMVPNIVETILVLPWVLPFNTVSKWESGRLIGCIPS